VIDGSTANRHSNKMQSTQSKALAALAFTTIVWGITPVFVRSFSLAVGPYQALIIRLILTGLVFAAVLALTTGFQVDRKDWPKLVALSLIGMLGYYVGTIFGFTYAPAGTGTLIVSTQPLLIAVLASFAGTERLTRTTILGLLVSLAGSALLVWGDNMTGGMVTKSSLVLGCALIFLAGLCWSIFVVFSKPLLQRYGSLKITGLSNLIIMLPALPFISNDTLTGLTSMNQQAWVSLAFLIVVGATLAVFTWNYAAGHLKPSLLGSAMYVMTVIALIAGWAILSEAITQNIIMAASLIMAGVAISQLKLRS
jgi:drug/metabolite transporter (DMT)-like permease